MSMSLRTVACACTCAIGVIGCGSASGGQTAGSPATKGGGAEGTTVVMAVNAISSLALSGS